jgi:hypothetical protein
MQLLLTRISTATNSTYGSIHIEEDSKIRFCCFSLEDGYNERKVYGKTRIPAGNYEIKLRNVGNVTKTYERRFKNMHKGMLWLQDVPNFEWVYIHIGNNHNHTEGCILVGDTVVNSPDTDHRLKDSAAAYIRLYQKVVDELEKGERVFIRINNLETEGE